MIFYATVFLLFAVLLIKIGTALEFKSRVYSFLILALYINLLLFLLLWPAPPRLLYLFSFSLFLAGAIAYWSQFLIKTLTEKRQPAQLLKNLRRQKGSLYEVVLASCLLSQAKLGALIIIERKEDLQKWSNRGIGVDAKVSKELLFSIFTPPGALHDGACVIKRNRMVSCAVIVPLTKNPALSKELGTRHRAAIGMSEISDALGVIVSEETGAISLADRGSLFYDIPPERLREFLERAMKFKLEKRKAESFPVQSLQPI